MNIEFNKLIIRRFFSICKAILKHKYTQYWLSGGRGSTKSSFIALIIVILLMMHKDANALVLRKVGGVLKDSVFNQILWAIDQLGVAHLFKSTKSPLEITYIPTGQKIFFRGADDPLKIKSIKPSKGYIAITWFEELDQFAGEEEIRSILQSANRGGSDFWNFFSFNPPKSRDNWANAAIDIERPDKTTIHSSYLDVPVEWLGEQFITDADELKRINLKAYQNEYLGEATGTGGAVFENIEAREITQAEIDSLGYFYFGVDFGFAVDPFVWVKLGYDRKTSRLWILDEIYSPGLSNRQAVDMIKARAKATEYIIADSAEPRTINEFSGLGLNIVGAVKGPDSIYYGVSWLQHLSAIMIDKKRTPNAYREFTCYEYDRDKNGNFISRFPDKNNHAIDAVRYALEQHISQRTVRVGSKSAYGIY